MWLRSEDMRDSSLPHRTPQSGSDQGQELARVVQVLRTALSFVAYLLFLLDGMAAWDLSEAISLLQSTAPPQVRLSTALTSIIIVTRHHGHTSFGPHEEDLTKGQTELCSEWLNNLPTLLLVSGRVRI